MREILEQLQRLLSEPRGGALVTITRTTGSTYRREGAKMICRSDGALIGSISGGCLESDVYERSREVVERNQTELVSYDTSAENENVWGLGLGCNGTVEVLIESVAWWRTSVGRLVFDGLAARMARGARFALVTLLEANGQPVRSVERVLIDTNGTVLGSLHPAGLDAAVATQACKILDEQTILPSRKVRLSSAETTYEVFIDAIVPPLRLLVVGGGPDAVPVVRMARAIGMMVTLIDSRPQFATAERFPDADQVLCVQPEEFAAQVSFEGQPAVVLMTHNYMKDRTVLEQILRASEQFTYIGALGPRARTEQMIQELRTAGAPLRAEKIAAIRTPVGLDLGADSPAEIALAVLAEVLAVRNQRSALPLREKKVAVHQAA